MPGCERKFPQGLSQVRLGLASSQFGHGHSPHGTGQKPLSSCIPCHDQQKPQLSSWRNMEGPGFPVSACVSSCYGEQPLVGRAPRCVSNILVGSRLEVFTSRWGSGVFSTCNSFPRSGKSPPWQMACVGSRTGEEQARNCYSVHTGSLSSSS